MAILKNRVGLRMIHFIIDEGTKGVVIRSVRFSEVNHCVHLDCNSCGAQFWWTNDREDHWIPDRRHLNFCPGCGKLITACEIPG